MPKPTTTVEVAFNVGFTGTPTWTDVTAYVLHMGGIAITRGRGSEGEVCGPNTLSLVLDNSDGRFTPGNTSGAHYPNVLKGRRIRVRSTHNAVTYDRFVGYVNDWRVSWPGKVSAFATCQVSASSRLSRLGNTVELRSIVEETILADGPVAYYTLGEPSGATSVADTSGSGQPSLTMAGTGTSVVFGNATGPGTDGLTAAEFANGKYLAAPALGVSAPFTVECWFSTSTTPSTDTVLVGLDSRVQSIGVGSAGELTTFGSPALVSAATVTDGLTHHAALTRASGGTCRLYLDGVEVDSGAGPFGTADMGGFSVGRNDPDATPAYTGVIAHVAVFNAELSAAQVQAHYLAGKDGFAGEAASARLTRYAAFAGVAAADLSLETGQVPDLVHIDTTGKTALAAMREVETTEGGVLFDAPGGAFTFHDRAHRYGAASAFTLAYGSGEITGALSPVLDDQQMSNEATATNADGVTARQVDTASQDAYGPYRTSFDLATTDADEPRMRVGWVVNRLATPTVRVSEIEVLLNTATNTVAAGLLAADVGTKLTLSGLPSNAPASSMALFVEGVSETITAEEHRIVLRTSPAGLYSVWLLGVAGASELGSTTILAY